MSNRFSEEDYREDEETDDCEDTSGWDAIERCEEEMDRKRMERDTFYALTDGQYGDYDEWRERGGDIDSLMDSLGY